MDLEKQAIDILRMLEGNDPFVVADSGGKDSSVLTHIALKSGCKFKRSTHLPPSMLQKRFTSSGKNSGK